MADVYQMVTDRIIKNMEQGIIPWKKPWGGVKTMAISHSTGKPYSLLNQMSLGLVGEWLTFKQIQDEGGKVKKGEKASPVVFWKFLPIEEENEKGEKVKKQVPFLKYYSVFHISQCEGINPKYTVETDEPTQEQAIAEGEAIIKRYLESGDAPSFHPTQGDRAYYSPDAIICVVFYVKIVQNYKKI